MIAVQSHPQGSTLPVRAKPGAKQNAVLGEHGGALRVSVTAPAEQGKANEAIIAVLAEALAWKKSQITLISGPTSRSKRFLFAGLSADELLGRLQLTGAMVSERTPD